MDSILSCLKNKQQRKLFGLAWFNSEDLYENFCWKGAKIMRINLQFVLLLVLDKYNLTVLFRSSGSYVLP